MSQGPVSGQVTDIQILMDYRGCRCTVWEGNGKTPCVYKKVDAQRKDGYPRLNDRASVPSGSAKSLIETCPPDSQPGGTFHSRRAFRCRHWIRVSVTNPA